MTSIAQPARKQRQAQLSPEQIPGRVGLNLRGLALTLPIEDGVERAATTGGGVTHPRFVELWFVRLYQAEHDKVFRATWAFCGDRTVAEDATQEAFARALERWRGCGSNPG